MKDRETRPLAEETPLLELPVIIWLAIFAVSFMIGFSLLLAPWWIVLFIFLIICIAAIAFLNPLFGVIIFLFGAFFHPTQHFPQLQQFNLAQGLAIGILLVYGFRTIVYRDFEFVKSKVNFFIALYLSLVFLSGTIEWAFSSPMLISQTIKVAVLYLVIVNMVKTRRQSLIIIGTIILIAVLSALMGVYQHIFKVGGHIDEGVLRVVGPESDPNLFAMHLVVVFPIVVNLFWIQRRKLIKVILLTISALLLTSIVLTYSRGAMVALAVIIFLIAVRPFFQRPRKIKPLVCVILAVLLFMPFIPSRYWHRAKTVFSIKEDTAIRSRLEALKAGIEMVQEHPIRGVGFGMFEWEYVKHTKSTYVFQKPMSAHNMYITLAAESGIFALFAFFLLVFGTFGELRKAQHIFRERGDVLLLNISSALEISIIGFLIGGFFLSQLYLLIFWIVISFSVSIRHLSSSNPLLSHMTAIKGKR